ncbi:MAG: hypothetical protein JKX79_12915, partial [Labilibaculum sp.]|nr:hypothetical protein [Labilibaculum sp.]
MKKLFKFSVIAILIGLFTQTNIIAQDNEVKNFKMLYKFSTTKQADNTRLLEVSFIARHKKNRKNKVPVFEAKINFYNISGEENILLGTVKTDKKGFARLILPKNQSYAKDIDGYINLKAVFEKTEAIKSYKKSVAIKDLILDLSLKEIDSVKTVILKAYTLDSLKTKIPVIEADVIFSIGGMISNMPIEEATIEDGEYKFEFPTNIPGDVNGDIDVFVSIEDHDDFGNVIQKKNVHWGTFNKQLKNDSNTLWSVAAPIWMYIVLSILLIG